MLSAFKHQLRTLSSQEKENFVNEIKRRTQVPNASQLADQLHDFVLVLPEMIAQVRSWMDDPLASRSVKQLHGFMLTYLFHPVDLIPEVTEGLFGYLDDAYVVGNVYLRTMTPMDPQRVRHLPNLSGISVQLPIWLDLAQQVLPIETRKIDSMLDDLCEGNDTSFNQIMEGAVKTLGERSIDELG